MPALATGVDQIIVGDDAVDNMNGNASIPIPNEWDMYGGGKPGGHGGGDDGSLPPGGGDDGIGNPPGNDAPVPEPATGLLLGAGVLGLAAKLRKRNA
jgi:hypothetical protein